MIHAQASVPGAANSLRVAAAQIRSTEDPATNLATVVAAIERSGEAGAGLVVFPEAAMASVTIRPSLVAEPLDGPFASTIRRAARAAGLVAVVGMFTPSPDGRTSNTLLVTGVSGSGAAVDASYDKIHLFDAFGSRESDTVAPGSAIVTVDLDDVRVGLATCYDVRFAAHFTELGLRGAQVVALPASWADGPGKTEQWDLLTRARAMDAQAWLVACGQAWQPAQGAAPLGIGRSVVVDPLGGVRARLDAAEGLLVTDLDLTAVQRIREQVPVLAAVRAEPAAHRRTVEI